MKKKSLKLQSQRGRKMQVSGYPTGDCHGGMLVFGINLDVKHLPLPLRCEKMNSIT